jgi:hypothetical protein
MSVNIIANTYAGQKLAGILSRALLPTNEGIVADNLVTVVPNVKSPRKMRKADYAIELKNRAAIFTPSGNDIDLDESVLNPVLMEMAEEFDMTALQTTWESDNLKPGTMNDGDGTPEFMQWLENWIADNIALANMSLYTRGKAGTPAAIFSAAYPGIIANINGATNSLKIAANAAQLTLSGITSAAPGVVTVSSTATLADGDIVTIVGADGNQTFGGVTINGQSFRILILSATTFSLLALDGTGPATIAGVTPATTGSVQFINQTNVIGHLAKIYSFIPDALFGKMKIIVPQHVAKAYWAATAAVATGSGSYYLDKRGLDFLGEALSPQKIWNPNTICAWDPANVFLGVDVLGEGSELSILPMKDKTLDETIRVKAAMKSDIIAGFYGETIILRPA